MISRYLCAVIGEDPEVLRRQHASTIRRQKAFAIAIHDDAASHRRSFGRR